MAKSPLRPPHDPSANATIMASAGTGKTWLLTTRLVRLLLDGARPEGILAITFTRKAAAEMQGRLAERLFELAAAPEPRLVATLKEMGLAATAAEQERAQRLYQVLLSRPHPVRITTFHAFCQEILRRFPLEADVPPGFELVEKTGAWQRAAWETLIAEATAHPDSALGEALQRLLHACNGISGLERALDTFFHHRSDWWAYTADTPDPAGHATAQLAEFLEIDPEETDPAAGFLTPARREAVAEFARLLARHPTATNLTHADTLATALAVETPSAADYASLRGVFLNQSGGRRSRKPSKALAGKLGNEGMAQLLGLHEMLCADIEATDERLAAQCNWTAAAAWYRAGQHLLEHYGRLKSEQRLLDFADLEWRAFRLLSREGNAQWVQYKLDERIDHLLVDEFQDTNPTQWRLLLPLLEEMAAGGERSRSVFLVGDAKQSIYRFRRAEPRLFDAAHDWLAEHLNADAHPLHTSWRSAPAIMACVNRLFGPGGPLADTLSGFVPHRTHRETLWGRVELLPLVQPAELPEVPPPTELRNPLAHPRDCPVDDRFLREGRLIAERIRALVDATTPIGEQDNARPLAYGDIQILVRNRTHVHDYEAALREAGIPYVGADRGTLLDSLEVQDMVALLGTLLAPFNNLALATVLRSPLFACDDAALVRLAAAGAGPWFERLQRLAAEASVDDPLQRPARCLAQWHQLAGRLPIHDLLDRIYSEGDVLARFPAAFPPHLRPRVEANLTRFIELALEIDAGRYPSLTGFLTRIEQMRGHGDEAPDEAPGEGDGDRVRLLTIHAAKGLEAPVVFLADSAGGSREENAYRALVEWPATASAPERFLFVGRKADLPARVRERVEAEQQAQAREAANLLYVALTRARQLLFLSGSGDAEGDLGWYGLLHTALAPGEALPAPEPVVIESGTPPPRPAVAESLPPKSLPPVPPGLDAPLDIEPAKRELAPSGTAVHTGIALPGGDADALTRGLVIHRLLELLSQEPTARAQARRRVAGEWALPEGDAELAHWCTEAEAVVDDPALAPLFDPGAFEHAHCEVPLTYARDGQTVHGYIDRLVIRRNEVIVVDYKTHHHAGPGNLAELAAPYREQLALYAEGAARLWPDRRIRTLLLFTRCRGVVETTA